MKAMPEQTSALEGAVLAKLLEGDLSDLAVLRAQLCSATVRRREWTGVGFWTEFDVDASAPRLANRERFQVTGVYGRHPALQAGIGFALLVEDGVMRSLEGYTYEEPWPDKLTALEIEQDPTGQERLMQLATVLHAKTTQE